MIDTIIKLAGVIPANTTTNDIAALDMPEDGEIMCLGGLITGLFAPTVGGTLENNTFYLAAEISFLSTNQIGVNDSRGSIGGIGLSSYIAFSEATETGAGAAKLSEQNSLCIEGGIPVNAGERVHLHGISSLALLTANVTFLMYIKTRGGGRRASKRR